MEEISKLIQQAKPLYFARKRRRKILASTAGFLCCCFVVFSASYNQQQTIVYDIWEQEIYSASNGSIIEDMGLPVDEYGLLWIG